MKKGILSHIPKENDIEYAMVQARVPAVLHAQAYQQMKRDNLTWRQLIAASLRTYLEERNVAVTETKKKQG